MGPFVKAPSRFIALKLYAASSPHRQSRPVLHSPNYYGYRSGHLRHSDQKEQKTTVIVRINVRINISAMAREFTTCRQNILSVKTGQ